MRPRIIKRIFAVAAFGMVAACASTPDDLAGASFPKYVQDCLDTSQCAANDLIHWPDRDNFYGGSDFIPVAYAPGVFSGVGTVVVPDAVHGIIASGNLLFCLPFEIGERLYSYEKLLGPGRLRLSSSAFFGLFRQVPLRPAMADIAFVEVEFQSVSAEILDIDGFVDEFARNYTTMDSYCRQDAAKDGFMATTSYALMDTRFHLIGSDGERIDVNHGEFAELFNAAINEEGLFEVEGCCELRHDYPLYVGIDGVTAVSLADFETERDLTSQYQIVGEASERKADSSGILSFIARIFSGGGK